MKLTNAKLKNLINEVLNESEYYFDKSKDPEAGFNAQRLSLASTMEPEGSRDRFDQVEKYLQLISKREMQDFALNNIFYRGLNYLITRATRRTKPMLEKIMQRSESSINSIDGSQESLDNWLDIHEKALQEGIDLLERAHGFDDLRTSDSIPNDVGIGKAFNIYKQEPNRNDPYPVKSGSVPKTRHRVSVRNAEEEIKDFYRAGVEHLIGQGSLANLSPEDREMFGAFTQ
jgi:hypothetical protein